MRPRDTPLADRLRERIAAHGPITFAEFVEVALYDPEWGYYTGDRAGIGRSGDFLTAPEAHPVFGHLLGRQAIHLARLLGSELFTIVELGAGTGALAAEVLAACRSDAPAVYECTEYLIVDISPKLRRRQAERLAAHRKRVRWCDLSDLPAGSLSGLVVANEFVDALPFHRLVQQNGKLHEIYVGLDQGALIDRVGPLSDPALADYFARLGQWPPEGSQVEVAPAAARVLEAVAALLDRGVLLTIDYGYLAEEWLSKVRPRGTFLAHYYHTANDEPYERIGRQDLTAHVDFTTLQIAGEAAGLRTLGLLDQRSFLATLGIGAAAEALSRRPLPPAEQRRNLEALAMLVDPGGMGRFKVLLQAKSLPDLTLSDLLDLPEVPDDPARLPVLPVAAPADDPFAELWNEAFGPRDPA